MVLPRCERRRASPTGAQHDVKVHLLSVLPVHRRNERRPSWRLTFGQYIIRGALIQKVFDNSTRELACRIVGINFDGQVLAQNGLDNIFATSLAHPCQYHHTTGHVVPSESSTVLPQFHRSVEDVICCVKQLTKVCRCRFFERPGKTSKGC